MRQIVGLVGVVAGYVIAMRFAGPLADNFLASFLPVTRQVIAFLAVFFACVLAASILGWILGKVMTGAGLGILNRIFGGMLGGAKGCFMVAVAVMLMIAFLPRNSTLLQGPRTMKYIRPMADVISTYAPRNIKVKYDEKVVRYHEKVVRYHEKVVRYDEKVVRYHEKVAKGREKVAKGREKAVQMGGRTERPGW